MMGERRVMQEAPLYGFSLERHAPDNHLLLKTDRFTGRRSFWAKGSNGALYSDVGVPRSIQI